MNENREFRTVLKEDKTYETYKKNPEVYTTGELELDAHSNDELTNHFVVSKTTYRESLSLEDFYTEAEQKAILLNDKRYICIDSETWTNMKYMILHLFGVVHPKEVPEYLQYCITYHNDECKSDLKDDTQRRWHAVAAAIGSKTIDYLILDSRTLNILYRANINKISDLVDFYISVGDFKQIPGVGKNIAADIRDALDDSSFGYSTTYNKMSIAVYSYLI